MYYGPHTSGPWHAVPNPMRSDGMFVVRDRRDGEHEAYPGQLPPAIFSSQARPADAHLIAAAPDLLAACKIALNDRMYKDWPGVADCLMAAIAKAEGR